MKASKKSLIASGVSLLASAALLAGSTFAWFTDSVTNTGNKIQSGKLAINAYAYDLAADGTQSFTIEGVNGGEAFAFEATPQNLKTDKTPIINDTLFEPGKSNAKLLKVENAGTLAAKIKLDFTVEDGSLTDALWFDFVQVKDGAVVGAFQKRPMSELETIADGMELPLLANENVQFILVYGMNESAGNAFMEKTFSADVAILAAQYTEEEDGFGSEQYDKDAAYPGHVATEAEFKAAFEQAKDGDKIVLDQDIAITNTGSYGNGTPDTYILANDIVIDLNGKTLTVNSNDRFMLAGDNITIKNGTIKAGPMGSGKISYSLGVTAGSKNALIENITIEGGIEVLGSGATATLRNVTSTATNYYNVYLAGGATATVESGEYTSAAGKVHFYTQTQNDKIIVNGGTFSGGMPTHAGSGTMNNNI